MPDHTPGPWEVVGATVVWSPSAKKVVAGASACEPASGAVEYERPSLRAIEEPAANARLIAAAPEMLAVLEWLDQRGGLGYQKHDRSAAVVAKARGVKQ